MTTTYTQLPSGTVLCYIYHDAGAVVCASDTTHGSFDDRAQNALQKAERVYANIHCDWSQPVGKIVDAVV